MWHAAWTRRRVQTGSILVADDQPHVVEALRLLLKPEGFQIHTADSPAGILDALRQRTYDVVLMDLNYARDTTSGREGLDVIGGIRQTDAVTPIVVMTAWSTVTLAVEAMQRGARDFIQKPWDNQRLLTIVRTQSALGRASRRTALLETRQKQDLDLASQVQQHLLPHRCPDIATLACSAGCTPAGVVGGDYYDFIGIDRDRTGIAIGDVSGKGVAAALLMASLQGLLRSMAPGCAVAVERLLIETNRRLVGTIPANKYATLFYGVYSAAQRSLVYANAGHNPPIVLRASGRVECLTDGGPVLGLFDDVAFATGTLHLAAGDRLLLYTDGVTETRNADGEEFGDERMVGAAAHADGDAAAIRDAVLAAQARFIGDAPRSDDMTLVVAVGC
jgi:sigma-B regulation protein RsbU (phosphoserine phosphatase)